jgi:hypothetical protein
MPAASSTRADTEIGREPGESVYEITDEGFTVTGYLSDGDAHAIPFD